MAEFKERWRELCREAAEELDQEKLIALAKEINNALSERDNFRTGKRVPKNSTHDSFKPSSIAE